MHKFELGITATDIVTGFSGIVMARIEYLTGCTQYCLQPKMDEAGKFSEPHYFDETRLMALSALPIELPTASAKLGADIAPPSI